MEGNREGHKGGAKRKERRGWWEGDREGGVHSPCRRGMSSQRGQASKPAQTCTEEFWKLGGCLEGFEEERLRQRRRRVARVLWQEAQTGLEGLEPKVEELQADANCSAAHSPPENGKGHI